MSQTGRNRESGVSRTIGIRHRVKARADGAASPTQVCVEDGNKLAYDLATETDELDWARGFYPTSWRLAVEVADDGYVEELKAARAHHLRWRPVRKNESVEVLSISHIVEEQDGKPHVLEIPAIYDGLKAGDTVAMSLGGSGDRFAFALSRLAEPFGDDTRIMRIRPALLQGHRERLNRERDADAKTLCELVSGRVADFFATQRRDRDLIRLVEAWRNRIEAMKARIGAEQRLRSHLIGKIFCTEDGGYPEGAIEVIYEQARANDAIIIALCQEENARNREVEKILRDLGVYNRILAPVRGVGPMIAARLIVAIGDIRRFETEPKLKAFLGAHVMRGGEYGDRPPHKQFARRRHSEVANWHPDGRQALFLLADQFNRNPDSVWGAKLREYKAKFRAKHGHSGSAVSVRAGIGGAFRAAEQIFLEAGLPDPMASVAEIGSIADYTAWVTDCLARLAQSNEDADSAADSIPVDSVEITRRIGLLEASETGAMVKMYSNGHIHKMALWRTVTKFVEWLWREWTRYEKECERILVR